jgi:hypothetical protein
MTADLLFGTLFAVGLSLIGLWGIRNVAVLAPPALGSRRQDKKAREIRRGAIMLMALGAVIMIGVLLRVISLVF